MSALPGFELAEEDVLGHRMTVFSDRLSMLSQLLERSVGFGEREYLVAGDRRLSFAEHETWVRRVAGGMRNAGVDKGDRVAIAAANSHEWVAAFWAAVSLGAVVVGLNAWWHGEELRAAITDCEPTLLIADAERIARIGAVPCTVVEIERLQEILDGDPVVDWPAVDEDDPAVILYTSGTTGRSKGAVHSHRNLLALVQLQAFITASRPLPPGLVLPPARIFTSSPLFHVSGLHAGVVAAISAGSTIIWRHGRFDPAEVMRVMQDEAVSSWSAVSTAVWRVVTHPEVGAYDLSSVRHIGGGGSAWSPALQERMRAVFGDTLASGVGYGLTECTALATVASTEDLRAHPDTVGRALPTVEIDVRDGEIFIRSPLVMLGYWRNEDATKAVIGEGRWLRTGDLGHVEDGLLFLSARRHDLIVRAAENVYPVEIENCLEGHPQVVESVVVGLDHEELGQEVCAVVVLSEPVSTDDLADYIGQRLAAFKVPSRWVVRTEPLPRTATDKVLRAQVLADLTTHR